MKIQKRMIIGIILVAVIGASSIIFVWLSYIQEGKKDLPDLTDRGAFYSDFFPTAVKPDFTTFQVWCDVGNIGESSSSDFNISYYASTDTIFSADDYLIGIDTISSISSMNYSSSGWEGVFPSSGIPDGNYYVGWIIDSEDDVSESDEANNIAYVSAKQLLVDSLSPSSSISYIPESIPNIISNSTTFTLVADDGMGSGLDSIEYRIDDGTWILYTGPFTLEGYAKKTHTIDYYSIDNVDNVETINSEIVNLYVPSLYSGVLFAPGAPIDTPEDRIIKIGILDDLNWVTGQGSFQGSYLAIKQINSAGGITITSSTDPSFPNGTYYFGLIAENTYEAEPALEILKGVNATNKMMTQHNADFVIGGFRTEAVNAYREIIMDAHKIFINTGAASDTLCEAVGLAYSRYKYWFRAMPINSSSLASEICKFYALVLKPALEAALGITVDKVGIIREDLDWTDQMSAVLKGYYVPYGYYGLNSNPWFNFTIVEEIAFPITATPISFYGYLNDLKDSGAQIVCPLISSPTGLYMSMAYGDIQPDFISAGINVMSQPEIFWEQTLGNCEYELLMQSTTRTNKTNLTIPMWDAYVSLWDVSLWNKDPLYTAIGSYDSVYMLLDAISSTQSNDSDDIVAQLETINKANPMEGAGGNIAFNSNHDLIEGYDPITKIIYSVALWVQWQTGGTKSVVTSGGYIYPEWIVDAPIQIPPWL